MSSWENGSPIDGKHYWLTPPELMTSLQDEFAFDFDACPFPKPDDFDGLQMPWGRSTYVNPPFCAIKYNGRKLGMTAWTRKALKEVSQGKRVVMVYPVNKWLLMLLEAGARVRNLKDVRWCSTEDGSPGPGMGRHIACFILEP